MKILIEIEHKRVKGHGFDNEQWACNLPLGESYKDKPLFGEVVATHPDTPEWSQEEIVKRAIKYIYENLIPK